MDKLNYSSNPKVWRDYSPEKMSALINAIKGVIGGEGGGGIKGYREYTINLGHSKIGEEDNLNVQFIKDDIHTDPVRACDDWVFVPGNGDDPFYYIELPASVWNLIRMRCTTVEGMITVGASTTPEAIEGIVSFYNPFTDDVLYLRIRLADGAHDDPLDPPVLSVAFYDDEWTPITLEDISPTYSFRMPTIKFYDLPYYGE